jgi:hypothetical protein
VNAVHCGCMFQSSDFAQRVGIVTTPSLCRLPAVLWLVHALVAIACVHRGGSENGDGPHAGFRSQFELFRGLDLTDLRAIAAVCVGDIVGSVFDAPQRACCESSNGLGGWAVRRLACPNLYWLMALSALFVLASRWLRRCRAIGSTLSASSTSAAAFVSGHDLAPLTSLAGLAGCKAGCCPCLAISELHVMKGASPHLLALFLCAACSRIRDEFLAGPQATNRTRARPAAACSVRGVIRSFARTLTARCSTGCGPFGICWMSTFRTETRKAAGVKGYGHEVAMFASHLAF